MHDIQTFAEAFHGIVCHVCLALLLGLVAATAIAWLAKPMRRLLGGGIVRTALAAAMVWTGIVESFSKHTNDPPRSVPSPLPDVTLEDISNGWRVAATREGREMVGRGVLDAPQIHEPWLVRGGFGDVARISPAGWSFPWRDGFADGLTVFSDGEIRPSLRVPYFPRPFDVPLAVVPAFNWHLLPGGVSNVFWHAATPSNSLVVAWENALVNRDASCLTNFQAEFFADGRFEYRYGDREVEYAPVFPFDWDGDGLENSVDPDPLVAGPDAHGTNAEWYNAVCSNVLEATVAQERDPPVELSWREGVNSNAYYFVDIVAEKGPVPICFTGDRTSRLGDPVVVALAGETNRVPLLVGIDYAVTSDTSFSVSFPVDYMYPEVETNEPYVARIHWPLEFHFVETNVTGATRIYRVDVGPFDPGGVFSWEMRSGGSSGGMPLRGGGCECVSYAERDVSFCCSANCGCSGSCEANGTYDFEQASFPVSGGECRCGFVEPDPPAPPPPPEQPSFSVSFSDSAVIFEDTYQDEPGVWKPRRSTRVWVSVSATGGAYGGSFTLVTENLDKLVPVACGPMVFPPSMDLGPYGTYCASFLCEGATESGSAGDVKISGTFVENETGASFSSSNRLTVVRILLTPVVDPPKEGTSGRHKYGVCEQVAHEQFPASPAVTWNPVGGGSAAAGANIQFPLYACENPLRVELGAVSYVPRLSCIEPTGIVTGAVDLCTYGLPPGKAGGIGLLQEMYVTPLTVSFSGIAVEEVPCDQGSVEGYFRYATPTNRWSHTRAAGAGKWRDVDVYNRVGGTDNVRDEAALAEELLPMTSDGTLTNDYSCGWLDGLMVWQVPFGWNEKGTTGASDPFNTFGTILQEFYIDRWGQTTVQKFGNRATRLLNGRRFLNSREIK
ncbi:MAG: hypothetical protein IJI36_05625 [Kiritimatiellae bacterium]|nr:hypothetical protein [Kiritimatiellia bacterium]